MTNENQERLTKQDLKREVCDLVDHFYRSGRFIEDAEEVLRHHADELKYYLENLQGEVRTQQEVIAQQQREAEEVEKDSVEPVG